MSEEDLAEIRELQGMAEDSWVLGSSGHRRETLKRIAARLKVLLDKHSAKPLDCSGDPSSCPDNEGYGCHCSANARKD